MGGAGTGGAAGGPPIVDLFNGTDLTGWTAYRQTNQNTPGTMLTAAEAVRYFKPENNAIRVYGDEANGSTQNRYTLVSAASYSKYNFFLDYQWGTKAFAPYTNLTQYPRDAGILFHIHGNEKVVWPFSIEFQIKDGTVGDIYTILARCRSFARTATGTTFLDPADGGVMTNVFGDASNYVQHSRSQNFEMPGWNSLELRVNGATAVYLVNGHIVNRVTAIAARSGTAVTAGFIALQAEHSEAFYRNVRIQVLP